MKKSFYGHGVCGPDRVVSAYNKGTGKIRGKIGLRCISKTIEFFEKMFQQKI